MGAGHSLTRQDLEVYEACTCLSGSDIIELWYKFTDLGGVRGKDADTEKAIKGSGAQMRFSVLNDIEATTSTNNPVPPEETGRRVTRAAVMAQPEFKHNPFKGRLCQIFTSVVDESSPQYGDLTFDEFVDMYNCLSPHAPLDVKMQTAFRLYDFDNNGYLTKEDIAMLLKTITFVPPKGEEELLDNETRENIIERVMKDCTRRRAHVGRARPTLSSHSLTTTTAHTLTHPRNAQATLMATTASRTPSSRRCCCACPTSGQTSRCTLCRRGERRME